MFGKLKEKLKSWAKKATEKEGTEKSSEKHEEKQPLSKKAKETKPEKKKIVVVPEKEKLEEKGIFKKITKKISSTTIQKKDVDEIFEGLELILLENNVALEVVDKIREDLHKILEGTEVKKGEIEKTILSALKESISDVLINPPDLIKEIQSKQGVYTILMFGINGSGKTTSSAKLANKLKEKNISCVLAAADTFRAASIEQLEKHGEKLGIKVIKHTYGSDPAAVAFDAIKYAEKNKIKCVIIDTAGRMYTKANLLKEMEKVIRVSKPDLKIFVGESITGNDATEQAKTFNSTLDINGIILTKADVDEKGGTALSVSYITKKPIYFLGTGQNYKDLENFKKEDILKNLGLEQ